MIDHTQIPEPDAHRVIWYQDGSRLVLDSDGCAAAYRVDGSLVIDRRFGGKFPCRAKAAAALHADALKRQAEAAND